MLFFFTFHFGLYRYILLRYVLFRSSFFAKCIKYIKYPYQPWFARNCAFSRKVSCKHNFFYEFSFGLFRYLKICNCLLIFYICRMNVASCHFNMFTKNDHGSLVSNIDDDSLNWRCICTIQVIQENTEVMFYSSVCTI